MARRWVSQECQETVEQQRQVSNSILSAHPATAPARSARAYTDVRPNNQIHGCIMGFQEHCAYILVCVENWMILMGCRSARRWRYKQEGRRHLFRESLEMEVNARFKYIRSVHNIHVS